MSYTIKYNRSTSHLAGLEERTKGSEFNYAVSACSALSRSVRFCTGASYEDLAEALKGLRSNAAASGRKVCKNCEKAAVAALEALEAERKLEELEALEAKQAEVVVTTETVDGAEHQVGDVLYFIPSRDRKYPSYIPAGLVHVIRVVDHVQATMYSPRFTYVVQVPGVAEATQGTDARELHAPGSVPQDYRFWDTYTNTVCQDKNCRQDVTYANSKIVKEPIVRVHQQPVYPGMVTCVERRVCAHH